MVIHDVPGRQPNNRPLGAADSHSTTHASSTEWQTTLQIQSTRQDDAGRGPDTGSAPHVAAGKLTELLVAQTLRTILPRSSGMDGGLASDTWRGMLADSLAQSVASNLTLVPEIKPVLARSGELK